MLKLNKLYPTKSGYASCYAIFIKLKGDKLVDDIAFICIKHLMKLTSWIIWNVKCLVDPLSVFTSVVVVYCFGYEIKSVNKLKIISMYQTHTNNVFHYALCVRKHWNSGHLARVYVLSFGRMTYDLSDCVQVN